MLDNTLGTYALKFSTKWTDPETGWSNYGRRYYDPRMGRFIGKDPIAEKGGLNLYGFCGNDGVNQFDVLGMTDLQRLYGLLQSYGINSYEELRDSGFFMMEATLLAMLGINGMEDLRDLLNTTETSSTVYTLPLLL